MKKLVFLFLGFIVVSCANKSADLVTPPPVYQIEKVSGSNLTFNFNPKVDILFVIDNSGSMKNQLERLKQASNEFVESFGGNSLIDYRLGVISAYDTRHCDSGQLYNGKVVTCYPQGKLRTPFVSRGPESKKLIFEALNIGTQDPDQGGPIVEEMFGPTLVALSTEMNRENGDFIRPDSHIVIVYLTDEGDSTTGLAVDDFIQMLGDRVNLYGVANVGKCTNAPQRPEGPVRLVEAIKKKNGKMFQLCDSSYGKSLATIGSDIRKRSLQQVIPLLNVPEKGTIKLTYGGKNVPHGKGWYYNPINRSIVIDENLDVVYDPNASFEVTYIKY